MVKESRKTKETDINLEVEIYGSGEYRVETGIGFFDHMLEAMIKHALFDAVITCRGDLHVDFHHTVEDVGIVLGAALKKEIFPIQSVERFADAVVVMDEAAVKCSLDLSNRPFLLYDVPVTEKVGEFDSELVEEFFRALVINAGLTVHLNILRGKNRHHIIEATFKAFAVALRRALQKNEQIKIPSTKGVV